MDQNQLWRKVVVDTFSMQGAGWIKFQGRGSVGMSLCRGIIKGWSIFMVIVEIVLGNESRISFWHDPWCGWEALRHRFPQIYNIASYKNVVVSKVWRGGE